MSIIQTITESEEFGKFVEDNGDVIGEAVAKLDNFNHYLKAYAIANPDEFIGENLDQTIKNIEVFSEVATAQYMKELTETIGHDVAQEDIQYETTLADYF